MGSQAIKKKKKASQGKLSSSGSKSSGEGGVDEDMAVFIDMARELKEEGNKLFQRRDYDGAQLKYDKAIKLLPKSHIDVAYLRTNIAACYIQTRPEEHHLAIDECNLALEVSPKYSKALLKRARCFEALNRFDLAWKDVDAVLASEPNNLTALEIYERLGKAMEKMGIELDKEVVKPRKKKTHKCEDKVLVEMPIRPVKLVFREDIRCAEMPARCSMSQLIDIVHSKFPGLKAVVVKYKDKEGDFVTITGDEELKLAEESTGLQGPVRLHVVEANPQQNGRARHVDDWIMQFAQLFKNHVGFDYAACLDLHELGMRLYSEAMEDTITSEEAQEIFQLAEAKFQEMTALALFNWGNVHMSCARKRLFLPEEDASRESILAQVKIAYEWACTEYAEARRRYEEALKIKPDLYEALLALAQQQFEQAKLSWHYHIGCKVEKSANWPSSEVLELFDNAEHNMEKGMEMWERTEERRVKELSGPNKEAVLLQKMEMEVFFKNVPTGEEAEQACNLRTQMNILWGKMLYERSIVEFRLGLPTWEDCLMEAVEKFKLAGASPTDIGVVIKSHCANEAAQEGLGFKIDEIVQAWNEMYDAKRWINGVPSFRLEPLLRRRPPKLHFVLEHI